jgi:membrane protease YdiL (CAAX protease family)
MDVGQRRRLRKRKRRPPPPAADWTVRYAVGALIVVVVAGIAEGLLLTRFIRRDALRLGVGGILLDLTMLSTLIPLYRRRRFHPRDLGLRGAPPASSVGWVSLAVIAVAVTNVLWLQDVLGLKTRASLGVPLRGGVPGVVLAGIFVGVLAPVTEEIFFRGLLYRALRNRLNVPLAAGIAGVLFAAVHGLSFPLDTLPPRLVFGVIACLLYERTGSLLPGIALHCLIDEAGYEAALTGQTSIAFAVFGAIALTLLLYSGVRRLVRPAEITPRPCPEPHR